jgi:transposase
MFSEELVFGSSELLEIMAVKRMDDQVVLSVQGLKKTCPCPGCNMDSNKVHSYYYRKIKDLPAFNNKICLHVKARKWYCFNTDCSRKIFTERFEHNFIRYKRTSDRLREKLLKIALLTGGNQGKRLCHTLNINISSSTLIRLIHEQKVPEPATGYAVGIDDWAFKKGISYGTLVVDLQQKKVVDLLPDREAQTVENWFRAKPEVTIVTRDRFSRYATGITNALPEATQITDRWHLLKNMGDALQKLLERKRQGILASQNADIQEITPNLEQPVKNDVAQNISPRQELMLQAKKMYAEGVAIRAIARTLGISRITVRKYIHLHEPPKKQGNKTTNLAQFNEYLFSRLQEDNTVETLQLFKEIKSMGYNGSRTILYCYMKPYTKQRNSNKLARFPRVSWVASQVKVLLCKPEELLSPKDKGLVHNICEKSEDIKQARILATKFRTIMDNKQGYLLKDWIEEVLRSSINELKSFAKGLLSDFQAAENALTLPWSNGQLEGQINKLKTIKRQMYGRASFMLLRKRVILSSGGYHQN